LSRLGAGDDLPIGTPVAGRTDQALDDLVGFFVNTLVLRTDVSGSPSFGEVLRRVRERALDAYAHQDVPFERLVEELAPARSMARHPLFQVMLALQNNTDPDLDLPGLNTTVVPGPQPPEKFDLSLTLRETFGDHARPRGISGQLGYATDLFEHGTVEAIAERFVRVLDAVTTRPADPVDRVQVLSAGERERVLVEWNDTARPLAGATLPELLSAQAGRTPDAVALVCGDTRLTYAELDTRANRLAHLLTEQGVGPESRVAVFMERSTDMVLALLAAVKAGAAYVPVDPQYPAERITRMLRDSAPQCVLTHTPTSHLLPETENLPRLVLDEPGTQALLTDRPGHAPRPRLLPEHPAYLIYTSGSTGTPKGVALAHRGIVNRLAWMQAEYPLDASDRVLQKTPYGFDVSVWEFFWPLTCGATLVMAKPDGHRDPAYLAELINTEGVTVTHFIPSMLQAFLQ
ncbi:AMP-binding protein, partial [Kitasatospora sp. NPDC056181]|uniref:non-ribosomal peptide synthetase n=1 Tax=Kitasatospora sp. NPDC056181 TaxID=3345737 RepID=UPI0035D96818